MKKRSSSVRLGDNKIVKSPSDTDIPKYTQKKKNAHRASSGERHNRKSLVSSDKHDIKSIKPSTFDVHSVLTPYDLVLAFERELLSGNLGFNPLSQEQINLLTAKETVKVKSKVRRKTILETSRINSTISAEALEEWNKLDMAKKERRVLEIIESRDDLRKLLTESALEAFPIPKKICDYNLRDMRSLIYTTDNSFNVELGDINTTYEKQLKMLHIEHKKLEVNYYTDLFANDEHCNFVALDKEIGPIVVSIQKQRKDKNGDVNANSRVLIRTKNEDKWLFLPSKPSTKELLVSLKKELPYLSKIKFEKVKNEKITPELIQLENVLSFKPRLKVGVLYVKGDQTNENDMFGNNELTPAFDEFLNFIGQRITLKDWTGFAGGLDTKQNLTGTNSVYVTFGDYDIMYHVSVLLPLDPNDEQQLERKRHIGNDVVCIIFLEDGDSFDPSCLTTNFTYIFIVIQPDKELSKSTGKTYYRLAVATKEGTRPFSPRLHHPALFEKNDDFLRYLLTKIINSEKAAYEAPAFAEKLNRTKESFLVNLINVLTKS